MAIPQTVSSGFIKVAGLTTLTINAIVYSLESITPTFPSDTADIKSGGVVSGRITTFKEIMLDIEANFDGTNLPPVGAEFTYSPADATLGPVAFYVMEPCVVKRTTDGATKQTFTIKAANKVGTIATT